MAASMPAVISVRGGAHFTGGLPSPSPVTLIIPL